MRYAFIKYGDVIDELQEIGPMPKNVQNSGHSTFTSNYLKLAGSNPTLLISCGNFKGNRTFIKDNIEAHLYNQLSGIMKLTSVISITN